MRGRTVQFFILVLTVLHIHASMNFGITANESNKTDCISAFLKKYCQRDKTVV